MLRGAAAPGVPGEPIAAAAFASPADGTDMIHFGQQTVPGIRGRMGRVPEFVAYVALAAVAAAAAFATAGLAFPATIRPDQLAWLGNDQGQTTGIDPETGQPVLRLRVGGPGDEMTVTQAAGVLLVTNIRTAEVTVVDLPTLAARQVRSENLGSIKVLLVPDGIYVVDKAAGFVERINALTAAPIGRPWSTDVALVDAVADGTSLIWVLAHGGQLTALRWSGGGLLEVRRTTMSSAGPNAVLVPHAQGVTMLDPDTGAIVQVGTGDTRPVGAAAPLVGTVAPADSSPADLVAVSATDGGTVLVIADGESIAVDVAEMGCARPGKPVIYHGRIYLSCHGARRVIVLDSNGRLVKTIHTPSGGTPALVLAGGLLIINVPGGGEGLIIAPDGSTRPISTDGDVPDRDVSTPTTTPPAPTRAPGVVVTDGGGGATSTGTSSAGPGVTTNPGPSASSAVGPVTSGPATTTGPSTSPASPTTTAPAQDPRPTSVSAVAYANGTVRLTWVRGTGPITGYRVLRVGSTAVLATPAPTAMTAVVNAMSFLNQPTTFVVEAVTASGAYRSAPSNVVHPYFEPVPRDPPPCDGCEIP